MINEQRLVKTFTELVSIDSPSFGERAVADYLRNRLSAMNITCTEDDAGEKLNGNCGNLFARVPATLEYEPLLFCTHMDTVEPSCGKRAVVHEDGKITSAGDTVLGADDFAGVAAILEALEVLRETGTPHRPLELLFTVAEEPYCTGVRYFDFSQCAAKTGFVLDLTGEIGTAAIAAPTVLFFTIRLHGRAAHAGFSPETGVNTLAAAANALSRIKQGRLDAGTTLNFGLISGGKASNIVPEYCMLQGEIRSAEHTRAMEVYASVCDVFRKEAGRIGAEVTFTEDIPLQAYRAEKDGGAVRRFSRACKAANIPMRLTETFGGSDNAAIQAHGIDGIVVANAMYNCHAANEYTTVQDLNKVAELVLHLILDDL